MRCVKEVLRQKWVLKKSHREVARALEISSGFVSSVITRAAAKGMTTWAEVEALAETVIEERLYGPKVKAGAARPLPDPAHIHAERKRPGVTLELLHLEYLEGNPSGYRYTAFCDHYRGWLDKHRLSMRQVHLAGEKMFVDYSGKRPHFIDQKTGEVVDVELFVAVLGASSRTYAEATMSQKSHDFILSHVHAFEFFGGVTRAVVPDCLKSAVIDADRYEPIIQRTYEELARHYGTTAPRWCRLALRSPRTRRRSSVRCRLSNAGFWRGCATRNSSASMR